MMKRVVCVLLFAGAAAIANAQSCTTAVCNAASPGQSDFLAALPSSSTTQPTVVVNIPAGSATWTGSEINYTIPSVVTSLTIQGATTINFTGTAGTSNYAATVTDSTTITDNVAITVTPMINIVTTGANQFLRITGLTIHMNAAGFSKFGEFSVSGISQNFRLDHIHAVVTVSTGALIRVEGSVNGVADHGVYDLGNENASILGAGIEAFQPYLDNIGLSLGDGSYANPTPWGSSHALYIESNIFNGGATNDCDQGGYYVERYNNINAVYVGVQTHGTKSSGGPIRGCRGFEAYHNYFTGPGGAATGDAASGSKIGTAIMWGNQMPQGYYRFFTPSADRNGGDSAPEVNNPNGWGYCGTTVTNPSTGNPNGTGAAWDGNQGSGDQSGYPCFDGIGRGQTVQALNGQTFPNRLNSVTGTIAWPHQYLEPVYLVMNTLSPSSGVEVSVRDLVTLPDRDYYSECNTGFSDSTCANTAFNGTHGTGFGLLSARPATCTAGPGGTYGASPTGSYGVGYFATDANGGAGELSVCDSTNHWKDIYQPYVYPNPLTTGGAPPTSTSTSLSSSNLSPPVGANITLTATVTPASGPTGTVTYYDGGASIGTSTLPTGTHTVTSITAGTHIYTATYGGSSGFASSTSSPVTVTTAAPASFSMSVTKAGSGTVTSSPAGINCGVTCSGNFTSGTVVTLTAAASSGSTFTGWSGACTGTGSCSVTLTSNNSVNATFTVNPTTFPLSVAKAGTGGGTITSSPSGISCGSTCSANFNSGTAVTLTATPDGSSTFGGWSGACTGIGTCSVTVNSSTSATATFTTTPPSGPVTFSPPSGTYAGPINVSLSSARPLIFYTRNGSTPNPASTQYASPIAISAATTLQAIAAAGGSVRRNTQATQSLWKICTPLGGGPGTPTSVMCGGVGSNQPAGWTITYGTTESISLTGTTGTPQILVTLGGSGCDSCTEETMDKWVKPLNALGHVQNHEMDAWHNDGAHNRLHMGGLQCNQQPGKLNWQVDNEQGSWQNTNITDGCPLSTTLWTHVIFHTHWSIGDTGCGGLGCTFYDYLEVCQASSPAVGCVPNHHVINMQLESDNPGWSAGCADQDQVDLNPGSTTSNPFTGGVLVQANNVTCAFGVTATSSANYSFTTLNPIINFSGHIQLSGQIHPQ